MKIREQYIQFAIDNGLELNGWENIKTSFIDFEGMFGEIIENRFKALITSKPFIESIARGLLKNKQGSYIYLKDLSFIILPKNKQNEWINIIIDTITHKQADAIRDGQLEDFIINLGIGKQEKN